MAIILNDIKSQSTEHRCKIPTHGTSIKPNYGKSREHWIPKDGKSQPHGTLIIPKALKNQNSLNVDYTKRWNISTRGTYRLYPAIMNIMLTHNSTCTLPNNLGSLSKVDILNVALALVKCSSDNWSSPGALAWKREGPVISIKFQVMYSRLEICFFKSIFIQLHVVLTTGFDKNWRIYRNTAGPFFPLSSIYSSTLSKR